MRIGCWRSHEGDDYGASDARVFVHEVLTLAPDLHVQIAQNIELVHMAPPLIDREWAVIHGNISPVFE